MYTLYKLADFLIAKAIAGAEIPAQATIGAGVRFEHAARGVVIHPNAVIGKNARIFHQVTIGANDPRRANKRYGCPRIGDDVFINAGAKISGPISVGTGARIGANSVVISDIPPHATAVGVSAREWLVQRCGSKKLFPVTCLIRNQIAAPCQPRNACITRRRRQGSKQVDLSTGTGGFLVFLRFDCQ